MKAFEVELRALLAPEQHASLVQHFDALAKGEYEEAKTYTFLTPHLNIKIKNKISKGTAKITVKKGAEYEQHADEIELPIDPKDIDSAVQMITALGFEKHIPSMQKRTDYKVGGITVSLKHETNWKYHMEAELVVDSEEKVPQAKESLHKFFKELGITPMTQEETRTLINSVITKYGLEKI